MASVTRPTVGTLVVDGEARPPDDPGLAADRDAGTLPVTPDASASALDWAPPGVFTSPWSRTSSAAAAWRRGAAAPSFGAARRPAYQPIVARPRSPLSVPPCRGLSRRCTSTPSSTVRLSGSSTPRP